MATTTNSTMFTSEQVNDLFSKVKGHSSLAKLCPAMPIPFAGIDVFTFSLDGEVSIVGEGENKPAGNATVGTKTIKPIKVVYQHRVTDEFLYMSEEKALSILEAFNDGYSKKIARGLDIMAMHGLNPADLTASATIGNNHFDHIAGTAKTSDPVADIEAAVLRIGDYDMTGIAMSKAFASALGQYKIDRAYAYPEFRMGANPGSINGIPADVNSTVAKAAANATADAAILGDFSAFRWGFAENIPLKVIEYGDPDGLGDLQRKNQVVLRAEAYIGWAILDEAAFSRITEQQGQ